MTSSSLLGYSASLLSRANFVRFALRLIPFFLFVLTGSLATARRVAPHILGQGEREETVPSHVSDQPAAHVLAS